MFPRPETSRRFVIVFVFGGLSDFVYDDVTMASSADEFSFSKSKRNPLISVQSNLETWMSMLYPLLGIFNDPLEL